MRLVQLTEALEYLKSGNLVAYPTETFYGLGADVWQPRALEKLFAVKGRDLEKAVSILLPSVEQIPRYVSEFSPVAQKLARRFLPGPLTLVLPASADLERRLHGGSGWIGIRVSSHPKAQSLVEAWGGAITTTSANPSAKPAAACESEVLDYFATYPEIGLLPGGDLPPSRGSTVLRVRDGSIELLRAGEIGFDLLEASL